MQAIISIHDVMPQHMDRVSAILEKLPPPCCNNLLLLIVPGLDWQESQIARLRSWQQAGHILAGHGWLHRSSRQEGLYHRLHAMLISRNAAEHLSLSAAEIESLIRRNAQWFSDNNLELPDYYVPPAWAMGKISRSQLKALPFRFYESTTGLYDSRKDRFSYLPLTGYEADNLLREYSLKLWNAVNIRLGSPAAPVRISIHPNDFSLRLAQSLSDHLQTVKQTIHYRSLSNDH